MSTSLKQLYRQGLIIVPLLIVLLLLANITRISLSLEKLAQDAWVNHKIYLEKQILVNAMLSNMQSSARVYISSINATDVFELDRLLNKTSLLRSEYISYNTSLSHYELDEVEQDMMLRITEHANMVRGLMYEYVLLLEKSADISVRADFVAEKLLQPQQENQDRIDELLQHMERKVRKSLDTFEHEHFYSSKVFSGQLIFSAVIILLLIVILFWKIWSDKNKLLRSNLNLSETRTILQQQVEERTKELEIERDALVKAKNEAEQANLSKSNFLANISHELRTPLHGILSFSDLGIKRLQNGDTAKIQRYLSNIRDSGWRLLGLIDGLLDLSKLEADKMELHFEQLSLRSVVDKMVAELEALIEKNGVEIEIVEQCAPCVTFFDKIRISQVVTNLLSNAIKFSPAGG